jgi:large subunit ribosomal protein L9
MAKQRNQIPKGRHGNMRLVLIEDVPHLGKQGQVVEVRPGYGRNYLLPNSLATIPTQHNLRLLERYKIRVQQAREARIADLKVLAEQVQRVTITIEANAFQDQDDPNVFHLYGSVGPVEISKALRARNLPIESEMVRMELPIKETGLYQEVPLNLGFEIETKVAVLVVPAQEKR